MLKKIIEDIREGSRIKIKGESYNVLTKTIYSPLSDTQQTYAKIVLSGHNVLVVVPYADFICLGHVENIFGVGKNFPEIISYSGLEFKKLGEDYQIVRNLVFGDPMVAEGEVFYADYINENTNISISLGLVSRTDERADIVQNILTIEDVSVEGLI